MNVNEILKEVISEVKPSARDISKILVDVRDILNKIKKNIKKLGISADVFIGGSLAKQTLIKKEKYDVDIFIRFVKKYKDSELSDLTKKILKHFKIVLIHGSRDYFQIRKGKVSFEIVPVVKLNKPSEARNVTDLSFFHVNYIKKKVDKNKGLSDEIILAKVFCHGQECYGAESYINGFSGYALELLICYYGNFLKFVKEISKIKDKVVIDPEKMFKSRQEVLLELNESKLQSPIIFIDPTYRQRNVLAALSNETFNRFREACKKFLKKPSKDFFVVKKIDLDKLKLNAKKKKADFIQLKIKTGKQEGDIAGSKLLKFYKFFIKKSGKYFDIYRSKFRYGGEKEADCYFILKKKDKILYPGPPIHNKYAVKGFKKKHKKTKTKNKKLYSEERNNINFKKFLTQMKKDKKILKEMSVSDILLVS